MNNKENNNIKEIVDKLKCHVDITFVTSKMRAKMGDVCIEDMFEAIEHVLIKHGEAERQKGRNEVVDYIDKNYGGKAFKETQSKDFSELCDVLDEARNPQK